MSKALEEIFDFNKNFVLNKEYEQFSTDKLPDKKLAILACMDARLTALLPAAMGFKNGDIKLIKNAGGMISHPFGSVMRSLIVCIYDLGVEEVLVVGHYDCGMSTFDLSTSINKMLDRGISKERIDMLGYYGIDIERWLKGFDDARTYVSETITLIKNHPLIPQDVLVHGLLINPDTGELERA